MHVIAWALGALLNALLLAWVARRLLGVPVGWPRTVSLSLLANALTPSLVTWALTEAGIREASAPGVAGTVLALSLLLLSWVVALQVAVLAILEALIPTGSLPGPVELVRSVPVRWRRLRRTEQILRIASKHGLSPYLTRRSRIDQPPASVTARALSDALSAGGVTFVKLGQMLSTRPDILAPEYVAELSRLHANVAAEDWSIVSATLTRELGREPEQVFRAIDHEPLAAASVGQVHQAELLDGTPVVVKVQRHDARAQVTADLHMIRSLANSLENRTRWARSLGVRALAEGFARSLDEELDYRIEAANLAAVRAGAPDGSTIRIPGVHEELTTSQVLVMQRIPGRPLSSSAAGLAAVPESERARLSDELLGLVLRQILDTGVFHADLHAGNVLFDPGDDGSAADDAGSGQPSAPGPSGPRLGLLDFGSVGRLDRGARASMVLLLLSVDRQDATGTVQALLDLLDAPAGVEHRALERDVGDLLMRYSAGSHSSGGAMFVEMLRLVTRHRLAVPPGVAAAFRSLAALEGTLRLISPRIDLMTHAREHGRELGSAQLAPEAVRAELIEQAATLIPLARRLPRQVGSVMDDLNSGALTVTVRALQSRQEREFVTGMVHQIVTSILAGSAAICGAALAVAAKGPQLAAGITASTYVGLALLLAAVVLGSRVVVRVFRGSVDFEASEP